MSWASINPELWDKLGIKPKYKIGDCLRYEDEGQYRYLRVRYVAARGSVEKGFDIRYHGYGDDIGTDEKWITDIAEWHEVDGGEGRKRLHKWYRPEG